MYKLLSLAVAATTIFVGFAPAADATVTWNFVVSSCGMPAGGPTMPCPPETPDGSTPLPGTSLATMVIDQPTASGTASWNANLGPPIPPAVVTGDPNFALTFNNGIDISPPSFQLRGPGCFFFAPCFYDLTWSETLGGLFLDIDAQIDDGAGLGSGAAGNTFTSTGGPYVDRFGCIGGCNIVGSWQSNVVPEPRSAALLLAGLLVTWMARGAKDRRASPG